ncbi:DUF2591 family protein [Aquipseudomonas alcaligenes]
MSQMKTVRTAELIGEVLDLMVAISVGGERKPYRFASNEDAPMDMAWVFPDGYAATSWRPSTEWSQGGRLLDQHCKGFGLIQDGKATTWRAFGYSRHVFDSERLQRMASGPSILVAACRAIVAANLGDEVQIPAELLP